MVVDFRVEIRDTSFNTLEVLDNEILSVRWDYSRIGGCGAFSFSLPRNYCEEKYISGDFNIRIYIRNPDTDIYDLWYQGLVEDKTPTVSGHKEVIEVSGHGYSAQLSRIQIDRDYSSDEIARDVVKHIMDNDITSNTDITYDDGDIVATTFTADTLEFNTDAKSAIETCADIAGTREWGVDKDRKFFFKARSSTPGFYFPLGTKITNFKSNQNFRDIVNRVVIQGGETGGAPYTNTYNDTVSQAKYNRRDKVIQNSAITTNTVASQYADAIFAEYSDVIRRASCSLVNHFSRIESTIPIPLFIVKTRGRLYGEFKYGEGLYSGLVERQVNRIQYKIDNKKNLSINLNLGQVRPGLAENIAQLEHQLEQQRSASL
jgi:hypothetical protein